MRLVVSDDGHLQVASCAFNQWLSGDHQQSAIAQALLACVDDAALHIWHRLLAMPVRSNGHKAELPCSSSVVAATAAKALTDLQHCSSRWFQHAGGPGDFSGDAAAHRSLILSGLVLQNLVKLAGFKVDESALVFLLQMSKNLQQCRNGDAFASQAQVRQRHLEVLAATAL